MPRRRSQSTVRALVLGVVGVLLGLGLVVGLSVAAGRGDVKLKNLGDQEFRAGRTDSLGDEIAAHGPFLLPDLSAGHTRDIYLQHLGDKWFAIAAGPRNCTIQWTGTGFRDPCSGATYPADGAGLTRYTTRVDGVALYVDFRTKVP